MAARTTMILGEITRIDGVQEALVVGRDGFVIDNAGSRDPDAVGAIVSTAIGSVEAMGRDAERGMLTHLMAEYDGGVIIVVPVGKDAMLGVVAGAGANLGGIRYGVKKQVPELERAL
jgi:uncharacterized protein